LNGNLEGGIGRSTEASISAKLQDASSMRCPTPNLGEFADEKREQRPAERDQTQQPEAIQECIERGLPFHKRFHPGQRPMRSISC